MQAAEVARLIQKSRPSAGRCGASPRSRLGHRAEEERDHQRGGPDQQAPPSGSCRRLQRGGRPAAAPARAPAPGRRAAASPRRRGAPPAAARPAARPARPQGTESPGSAARLQVMVKMSARYICSGSPVFSPSRKAGPGATGPATTSHRVEGGVEVAADEGAHLLGPQVVGVVVAGAERVGAEHDAPLRLGAEALLAALGVELLQAAHARGAVAEADAVVARQVGRGLGGGDEVVGADAVLRVGQRDLHQGGARAAGRWPAPRAPAPRPPARRPPPNHSRGTPMRSPRAPALQPGQVVVDRPRRAGQVVRIVAGDGLRAAPPRPRWCGRAGRAGRARRRRRPRRSGETRP